MQLSRDSLLPGEGPGTCDRGRGGRVHWGREVEVGDRQERKMALRTQIQTQGPWKVEGREGAFSRPLGAPDVRS